MNKIKLTTNRGIWFDWWLNLYLNFVLWLKMINDEDQALEEVARQLIALRLIK